MKAIKQIIDYLRQRGELDTGQMSDLVSLGLVGWEDLGMEEPEPDAAPAPVEGPPPVEVEEEVPGRRPTRRKGHGRRRKPADLSERELCRRLNEFFEQAEPKLVGLVRLAQLTGDGADWPAAAVRLRNASVDEVAEAMERGFRTHVLSLAQFWDFLAEEEFRTALPDEQLQGPVGVAYRALLAVPDTANLGRHAALLHHDEVQKVFNLRMAQRQAVRAWLALYQRQPELIGQLLRRGHHWLAYWSMVVLYTARRGTPGHYPPPAAHECRPQRPLPDKEGMGRAWAHAAFMDPMAVLPLLRERGSEGADDPSPEHFLCPRSWERHSTPAVHAEANI